jgi:5-methylcytosine-specific restriction endonuclease McrA
MPVAPGKVTLRTSAPAIRYDEMRQSSSRRGYDRAWYTFLAWYRTGGDLDGLTPSQAARIIDTRNRCRGCGATGRLDYDHIVPLDRGGARLDPANVQPLCRSCHVAKTRREQRNCQN